jgi:hypothetical protein
MNVEFTAKKIKVEIVAFSTNYNRDDRPFKKFLATIARLEDEVLLESVLLVIENEEPFTQGMAGRILDEFCLISDIPLGTILDRVIENWDESVEALPFWFVDNYGREAVFSELYTRLAMPLTDIAKRNINTMKWWLTKPNARQWR